MDSWSLPLTALDLYGLGALAAVILVFYGIRRIPAYIAAGAGVVVLFATTTYPSRGDEPSDWIVMTAGLLAMVFGLLIVRVMLIRSVSLQLLRQLEGTRAEAFGEDIRGRLDDLRTFRLVRSTGEGNSLTTFGRLVGGIVGGSYRLLGIDA